MESRFATAASRRFHSAASERATATTDIFSRLLQLLQPDATHRRPHEYAEQKHRCYVDLPDRAHACRCSINALRERTHRKRLVIAAAPRIRFRETAASNRSIFPKELERAFGDGRTGNSLRNSSNILAGRYIRQETSDFVNPRWIARRFCRWSKSSLPANLNGAQHTYRVLAQCCWSGSPIKTTCVCVRISFTPPDVVPDAEKSAML